MSEKRSSFLLMLNISPASAANYKLIGDGVSELTIDYNPKTKTQHFISKEYPLTDVTSYQPCTEVSMIATKGDGVYDFINSLRKSRATLSNCQSDVILVEANSPVQGGFEAQKQKVSIQIDSFGGSASEPLKIGYTLNFSGEFSNGVFDAATRAFTPSISFNCNLASLSFTGGTLSPAFSANKTVYTTQVTGTSVVINATAADSNASVLLFSGNKNAVLGSSLDVVAGENVFTIRVNNGTESKSYIICVTK